MLAIRKQDKKLNMRFISLYIYICKKPVNLYFCHKIFPKKITYELVLSEPKWGSLFVMSGLLYSRLLADFHRCVHIALVVPLKRGENIFSPRLLLFTLINMRYSYRHCKQPSTHPFLLSILHIFYHKDLPHLQEPPVPATGSSNHP